jgi:hypothetical protein
MKVNEVLFKMKMDGVLPKRKILDGKGNLWEWSLAEAGWNDLADNLKVGKVIGIFKLNDSNAIVFDVEWPAVNHISRNVFPGEVIW